MLANILFLVIFGAIVGFIASIIAGEGSRVNGWMNVVVGVAGALLGGLVMNLLGGPGITGFNVYSFLVGIGGAILLIWVVRAFSRS
jgi:uncharacterized membrane protein YeaQ/YmgE (transglycosylase-associated protein family)